MLVRCVAFVVALLLFTHPVLAKNLAFPEQSPIGTIVLPDSWKPREIEFGWEAKSPNDDIYFSIEMINDKLIDKVANSTDAWMKDNKIQLKANPVVEELTLGGLFAKAFKYQATDENGPTVVYQVFVMAKKGAALITIWGSEEEQKTREKELDMIMNSIKAVN